eukprot:362365-Rhodomonas_salina.1
MVLKWIGLGIFGYFSDKWNRYVSCIHIATSKISNQLSEFFPRSSPKSTTRIQLDGPVCAETVRSVGLFHRYGFRPRTQRRSWLWRWRIDEQHAVCFEGNAPLSTLQAGSILVRVRYLLADDALSGADIKDGATRASMRQILHTLAIALTSLGPLAIVWIMFMYICKSDPLLWSCAQFARGVVLSVWTYRMLHRGRH